MSEGAEIIPMAAGIVERCTFDAERIAFVPPLADRLEIAALDEAVRKRLDLNLTVVGQCHLSRNRKATYASLAARFAGSGLDGFSAVQIKRRYLAFVRGGFDWRLLVPKYHRNDLDAVSDRCALPKAFLIWWPAFAGAYTGGTRAAHTELARRWSSGEEIPGLGSWMANWQAQYPGRPLPAVPPPLPRACSYENLLSKMPKGAELTVVREGFTAAKAELQILRRNRADLRALELVTFDDHPLDWRVLPTGGNSAAKLLGLFALDVSCGYLAQHGAGARTVSNEGVERALTRSDGRGLLYQFLRRYGVPRHYTMNLLFERASFAIDEHDVEFLERLTAGRIKVARTNVRSRSLLAGGPREKVASPEAKGWIESYFNLLDRACSALPGQAGRNPLTAKRGDIDAVEQEVRQIAKAMEGLPPAIQELVRLPILTEGQGKVVLTEIINRLNARTNHRLQGFEPVAVWRLRDVQFDNPWRPLAELPPHLVDVVEYEQRIESPAERFTRLYRPEDFEAIPDAALLPLLDDKRTVTVSRPYYFDVQIQKQPRMYMLEDPRTEKIGQKFTAVFDRADLDHIHLLDTAGAYVGTAALWKGPSPIDRKAIGEAASTVHRQRNLLLARAQELHKGRALERIEAIEQSNAQLAGVIAEAEAHRITLTPEEQAGAERIAPAPKRGAKRRQAATRSTLAGIAAQAASEAENFPQ